MLINVIIIVLIAFSLISAFYIQRKLTPTIYFGFKEYVYELSHSPLKVKHILAKSSVIVVIVLIYYVFFQREDLIIIGVSLGCFLLVWPEIIAPEYTYSYSLKARFLLLMLYVFFVCTSGLLANLTVFMVDYIVVKNYSPFEVVKTIGEFIFSCFGYSGIKFLSNLQITKESKELRIFDEPVDYPLHSLNYNEIIAPDENIDHKLEDKINEIIDIKPVLGGQKWFITSSQWLLDNVALVKMEDGHTTIALYIKYNPTTGDVKIIHLVDEL